MFARSDDLLYVLTTFGFNASNSLNAAAPLSLSKSTPAFSDAMATIAGPLVVVISGIAILPASSGFHKSSNELISTPAEGSTTIPILFNV